MSIRTNDERKYSFEGFCESIGITVTAAVNIFMSACLRENRIPFEIKADPFWSEENQKRLRTSLEHAKQGKLTKHEISEVD
ncbi:type II toxin-antitoxin system RelB/DinJ family antitoxin [uncultured Treponema sp.]|uniref:type II toxin-antitoxin system RelB/DinJ family antitoxin n=1 Tax=uncultured Treponema sp. TaxID=162155 RepID=UPI0026007630|nr:type II toxin-antitoxin system RelB/DinJ family antitoxin [uncultured Treponema sp.]